MSKSSLFSSGNRRDRSPKLRIASRSSSHVELLPPVIPGSLALRGELWKRVRQLDLLLVAFRVCDGAAIGSILKQPSEILQEKLFKLRHPLGEIVTRRWVANSPQLIRSGEEESALNDYHRGIVNSLHVSDPAEFLAVIKNLYAAVSAEHPSFRRQEKRSSPDVNGFAWVFPPAAAIEPSLRCLHSMLFRSTLKSRILDAIVTYAVITWIHGFQDGNGRISRILFNSILREGGMPAVNYIPLKEFNIISLGGHEIRLRATHLSGEFDEIIEYFIYLLEAYAEIVCGPLVKSINPKSNPI